MEGQRLATEADRVKSRFLANMSHEVRTPLNGVLGALHLLTFEPMSPEATRLLAEARTSGRILTGLLNDLLDLADLEAARLTLSYEDVDPLGLMQSVLEDHLAQMQAKGLKLEAQPPRDQPPHIVTDGRRLRQILSCFLDNAAKFTEHGGVTVRLLVAGAGAGRRMRFEVEDTGIGVVPETIPDLFANFVQADDTATRRARGVGSGLPLSRKLARLMGGQVGGSSTLGAGSTFWVELPAPGVEPEADDEAPKPLEGLSVLVVDDNATNRLIATRILEHVGADVDTASDGASPCRR